MTGCQCNLADFPGHCPRHGVDKSARWAKLCHENPEFFRMYEEGRGPEQRKPKPAVRKSKRGKRKSKRGQRKAIKRQRKAKPAFAEKKPADLPCVHRGEHAGTEQCKPCQNSGKREVAVYHCGLHKFCTMHNFAVKHEGVRPTACITCDDRTERASATGKIKVGYLTPSGGIGGAEQIANAHIKYARKLDWIGTWYGEGAQRVPEIIEGLPPEYYGEDGLARLIDEADVLYSWGTVYPAMKQARDRGKPVVYGVMGHGAVIEQMLEQAAPLADAIWLSNNGAVDAVPSEHRHKARVVHVGIDTDRLLANRSREVVRAEWGVGPDELAVGYVGRLSSEKNVPVIAEASALIPNAKMVVCTPQWQTRKTKIHRAIRHVLKDRLVFTSTERQPLGEAYRGMDVMCITSPNEGGPVVLREAWWMRVPVVSTPVGFVKDFDDPPGTFVERIPATPTPGDIVMALGRAWPAGPERIDRAHEFVRLRGTVPATIADWEKIIVDQVKAPAAPVRVKAADPHESVTACITEFRRPESLKRLQASLAKHLPDIKVDVEPTGGNLSAARNRLAERCRTPYYLMLEEDFEVDGKTDIRKLVRVLESDAAIGGVSTVTREPKRTGTVGRGGRVWWARDFSRVGDWCEHHPSRRAPRTTPDGIDYQPCDLTLCFGVFRTEMMRAVPFDEKIEVGQELVDWFWRVWLDARWGMALVREPMIWHIRDRPGPEYNRPRNRNFRPYVENKLGVTLLGRAARHEHNGLPNVVYLTTGCANSTINMAMAVRAFGFHTGELDERFMEERRLREENRRLWRNSQAAIDRVKVERIMRTIPEPWILKEPSWAKTLARWHGVFERYRPHLVFVEKDLAVVRESIRSRGWNAGAYADIARSAQEQFDKWPWGKSRWTAEQIGEAVSLFDPERMAGPIEQEQDPARRALSEAAPNWRQWPEKRVNDWLKSWRHGATNV